MLVGMLTGGVMAVIVAMPGVVVIVTGVVVTQPVALNRIAHASQHASPGRLQHLDNCRPQAPAARAQEQEVRKSLARLRYGDGPLSVRVRPSALKRDCEGRCALL